jgi:hypothetical protein
MFAVKPEQRPTAVQLKQNLKILMGIDAPPPVEGRTIIAWQQLSELLEKRLEASSDFRLSLTQPPGLRANIDVVLDDAGYRVSFNSEKSLGRVLSAAGRQRLAQLGFGIDETGNYFTRRTKDIEELPEYIVDLVKSGLEMSLAELTYEFI